MKNNEDVPYIVHEGAMARLDRIIKRLWITVLLLIILLVTTNACWIWYESQFDQVTETTEQSVEQEAGGNNTFIGGDGDGVAENNNEED